MADGVRVLAAGPSLVRTVLPIPPQQGISHFLGMAMMFDRYALWALCICWGFVEFSSARAEAPPLNEGPLVLYRFDEWEGEIVHDVSGVEPPLDLVISKPERTRWAGGHLVITSSTTLQCATTPKRLSEQIRRTQSVSVEAWIRPAHLKQTGPARIVSISTDPSHRNLTLGQQEDAIEVRLRTTKTSENGLPGVASPKQTLKQQLTHLVFTRDADGIERLYVDGVAVAEAKVAGDLSNWNGDQPLILANEATGDRPWFGELHQVALFSRSLSGDEIKQRFAAGCDDTAELAAALPPAATRPVDFVRDVQPILRERCYECHATGNEEAGLNLAIKARVWEGGEHGPVLKAGDSVRSPLIHLVSGLDENRVMPPDGERLTEEQIGLLRAWIDQGAEWPAGADVLDPRLERAREHWAFQRFAPVAVPAVDDAGWARTPIDRFIIEKLRVEGLSPSPVLDPRRLVRRLHFDLVGLPPTPEEIASFLEAAKQDLETAIAQRVDVLLASQHYGERWARHWLDVARYADSDGQEADRDRPYAYHYRDFVIRAFNDDLPYDTFVRWQVAGDEYEPDNADAVAATGFLTAGPNTVLEDTFLEEERLRNRYNELDDIVSTLGTGLLGLTIGCARCHDHKYDAISAREYYRLLSAFHSGDRQTGKLPDGRDGLFFRDFGTEPRTSWLFRRGDFYDRDLEVRLGFPAVLSAERSADDYLTTVRADAERPDSTHQRQALAEWLTDLDQGAGPLLARVIVNRIWQHHFGVGLVKTESDFGVRGEAPSHPQLLEWLTQDFVEHGWRIKRLHRLIMTSAVYQQDVAFEAEKAAIDPENRLLWRMRPRRLEAEILRDAMLAVSDTLNLTPYGPGFKPPIPREAIVARNLKGGGYPKDVKDNAETHRRSVYMFHKRVVPYPLFQAFDRPDLLQSCGRRQNTTVAPQALSLLNDTFVRARAADFANRLLSETGADDASTVDRAFELALGRLPNDSEREASIAFLTSQTRVRAERGDKQARQAAVADFCQSLFGLNEFLYVD